MTDYHKERESERNSSRSNRQMDDSEDIGPRKRIGEDDAHTDEKDLRTREDDLEEEQRKFDEEMEKRRRRVQEWQELKRKREESETEKLGGATNAEELIKSGKSSTLEGESDDEESAPDPERRAETDMHEDDDAKPKPSSVKIEDGMAIDHEMGDLQNGGGGGAMEGR